MIGIYRILSPSGKNYIGQSVDMKKRFYTYRRLHCKSQRRLYNSLIFHGADNHIFEILCECTVSELNNLEHKYQLLYDCLGINGLNCRVSSSDLKSGWLSYDTKKRVSAGLIGKTTGKKTSESVKENIRSAVLGRKHSEQSRLKMKIAQKGILTKESAKIKIKNTLKTLGICPTDAARQLAKIANQKQALNIETGIYYESIKEAAFSINMPYPSLTCRLNGYLKNTTNFIKL